MKTIENKLEELAKSKFRSQFHLQKKDIEYIQSKGIETILKHAHDFVEKRLAPQIILKDGKQTPMRGHPVFIAQHATATCCRACLRKWHKIPKGVLLSKKQQEYVVEVIMAWIKKEMEEGK